MHRIIDVTKRGVSVRLALNAVEILKDNALIGRVSIRDIEALIISEVAISISGAVVAALSEAGILILFCDKNHRPVSIVQPIFSKCNHTEILVKQINAYMPIKKRLWQQLITEKIAYQKKILEFFVGTGESMAGLAYSVKSGDPENIEGMAARIYWSALNLFPKRDRRASDANRLFNYAYMVLLSLAGRAVCATGLNPSLGLHHSNGRNPFCLVCDFMEPFRVIADYSVLQWLKMSPANTEVSSAAKNFIVNSIISSEMECDGKLLNIVDALYHSAVSLRESLVSNDNQLVIPAYRMLEAKKCG
jgi:CRISPR-associated protein Cas1